MGIKQQYVVECEDIDCDEVLPLEFAESAVDARSAARAAGWKLTKLFGWLCPYCQYMAKGDVK